MRNSDLSLPLIHQDETETCLAKYMRFFYCHDEYVRSLLVVSENNIVCKNNRGCFKIDYNFFSKIVSELQLLEDSNSQG